MTRTRLTAEERQEQLIEAAVRAFGENGYAGTTTDQVARLAGVSQPYVIRLFRTKQELFLAAVQHAGDRIEAKWREAAGREATLESLGGAYKELLEQPGLMNTLLHGFAASADPAVGEPVRTCFGRLYDVVRELTGADDEEARDFFAFGMLLTCLGSMRVIGPGAVPPPAWAVGMLGTFKNL
ncbi:TetR/AcrR family transcriptional regulator [Paractinoplanes bogorensis]|uniref:TetR/AcrR family transcriptional regulator n=1 Tax=Paractinoplanes bogorensis TaxID=1610840 RepID=UPI003F68C16A